MLRNSDYTRENLLDYLYHQNYRKLICIDLSRQKIQIFLSNLFLQEK